MLGYFILPCLNALCGHFSKEGKCSSFHSEYTSENKHARKQAICITQFISSEFLLKFSYTSFLFDQSDSVFSLSIRTFLAGTSFSTTPNPILLASLDSRSFRYGECKVSQLTTPIKDEFLLFLRLKVTTFSIYMSWMLNPEFYIFETSIKNFQQSTFARYKTCSNIQKQQIPFTLCLGINYLTVSSHKKTVLRNWWI